MRNPQGYANVVGAGLVEDGTDGVSSLNKWGEADTFTCYHCQRIVHVPVKGKAEDIGGQCKLCMGLICPRCVGKGCTPWEKQMEIQEAREDALRSYGL
jgi:hypothetical protein